MKNVSQESLREVTISLPPLPEQRRIARTANAVRCAVQATRSEIQNLRSLRMAIVEDLVSGARKAPDMDAFSVSSPA
jgi:hypothetical protein